jgi:hypothetical protein
MLREFSWFGRRRLSPDLVWPIVLLGIGILFFFDFLFSSKNFYFRDILNFHYPLRKVLIDSYARGEFPLWNPFVYLGQPMLANPNYMAFYPTNLFHLIMPFNYAFKLHFIIHPILAGLGAYFLQRRLGISSLAAFTGSLAYEFSGTVLSFLNLYNIVPSVALLPWIGWAFYGALRECRARRILLFGALLGLQAIAFEPLMFQCVLWLLAGLAVLHLIEADDRAKSAIAVMRVGFVGVGFSLGLAAIQILPALELLPLSTRGKLDYVEVSSWSMHPLDFLNTLVPNLFGNYYSIGLINSWGESIHHGRESYLVSFFLGTCTVLLALLSFAGSRKKLRWVLLGLVCISVFLALGNYNLLYHWLYDHIPLFALGRYPSKYFLLTTLMICMMASMGVEAVLDKSEVPAGKRRIALAICGLLLAAVFLAAWLYLKAHPAVLESWMRSGVDPAKNATKEFPTLIANLQQSFRSSWIFLLAGSALVLAAPLLRGGVLWKGLLPVLVAAELIPANLRLSPLISDADVSFVPEVSNYIKQRNPGEPFRVIPPTLLKPISPLPNLKLRTPNRSSAWLTLFYKMSGQPLDGIVNGIQYSIDRSVDNLNTRESDILWRACERLPRPTVYALFGKLNAPLILSMEEMKDPRLHFLSSFDTRSVLPVHVYWLDNAVRRAYFASGLDFAVSQRDAFNKFLDPDFPVGIAVILEGRGQSKIGEPGAGSVRILKYGNSRVACVVHSRTPGHLVLLDSYYPGWIARVDGKETKILRANYAFRAVPVSPGEHFVEFVYRPRFFYAGLAVTSLFLLGGLVAILVESRKFLCANKWQGGSSTSEPPVESKS